mmetsp:Transcript_16645/g.36927  ORF Transcript_16645/g.36927 Transcript_16645/m.36927 type:complete len:195 (-) Transcript_16645:292-876(-)|eukprot:CAMPEP_0173185734 /NCGR_PEP_ID=MMETSP1141-20130122/9730_1 /TAXON_ID=483371 /ORGANISM="non described non described, Strain CCMP2298" /LENGTH=194 /DNA_ID=CAMNT_0014109317 /DNA_START=212 /DNA_END=796 /DNA_ORIENTATION=-
MPKDTINWTEAMDQVGGDREFLDEVLQDLLEEARTAEEEIADAIRIEDFSQIMKAAHRIKGSASYLCCEDLKDASLKLQEFGHEGTKAGAKKESLMKNIRAEYVIFEQCLRDLRAEVARSITTEEEEVVEDSKHNEEHEHGAGHHEHGPGHEHGHNEHHSPNESHHSSNHSPNSTHSSNHSPKHSEGKDEVLYK